MFTRILSNNNLISAEINYRYIGKKHISSALESFHRSHPEVSMAINITRHPFSFRGDRELDDDPGDLRVESSEYAPLSQLQRLGNEAEIRFKIDRTPFYNPLDSQRALLWAARFGKQEELADVCLSSHFNFNLLWCDHLNIQLTGVKSKSFRARNVFFSSQ